MPLDCRDEIGELFWVTRLGRRWLLHNEETRGADPERHIGEDRDVLVVLMSMQVCFCVIMY